LDVLKQIKLLAIDLDGTLVDSAPDLAHCVDTALAAVGLPPAGEMLTRGWVGDGIESLLARALQHSLQAAPDRAIADRAFAAFNACYERNLFNRSRVYPGVPETLNALRERGLSLCCITNKRIAFAEGLLREAELFKQFEFVLGGDSLAQKKPHPEQLRVASERTDVPAAHAALVGDSEHDYGAARRAKFAFIWAAYGYRANVTRVDDDEIFAIERFAELNNLLRYDACRT
jgi:phosphoglycolate phosphatase